MSSGIGSQRTYTPRRSLGNEDAALDEDNEPPPSAIRRVLGRMSFAGSAHRPSFAARWKARPENEEMVDSNDKAPIPTMLQPAGEVYSTPLPILSMIVLSITLLGEFLSANVSAPFLLFMVKGFGELSDDAEIAFWTGILVATFFLTQFMTSLLWATVAEKHGRRLVLVISLIGSAVTCCVFGTCTSLEEAICIRLLQGIFAGAVGVARGSVSFVTDASNEGRAYAILGFCWGFGGVAGAIIGGSFEHPAQKWPEVFAKFTVFIKYPYLLPCCVAASITFSGGILGLFLGPDGGPREGAIQLGPENVIDTLHPPIPEESAPPSPIFPDEDNGPQSLTRKLGKKVSQKLAGYFATRVYDAHMGGSPASLPANFVPLAVSSPSAASGGVQLSRSRTFSNRAVSSTNRADGSAYGYSANRVASNAIAVLRNRRWSNASLMRRRRTSNADIAGGDPNRDSMANANFAQRLLMAHGDAVTNIADLWVASAMNVDTYEDPFESDTEMAAEDVLERESFDFDSASVAVDDEEEEQTETDNEPPSPTTFRVGRRSSEVPSTLQHPSNTRRPSTTSFTGSRVPLDYGAVRRPVGALSIPHRKMSSAVGASNMSRRVSAMREPSIFSHPGVKIPTAVIDAQELSARVEADPTNDPLHPILEGRRANEVDVESALPEKGPSLSSQLPILVIIQYGLLALHSTTHDQVFMSYLVTDYDGGGLNLNAGHFAQLIALMCLAQIVYQFYLYPNLGPPRGRFSHLTMFRLGSFLFIPAYLIVILFRRPFASETEDGNLILMSVLAITTAVRFCGNTFAYTSVAILLNYMTPPEAVGFANGIAQSIVSLARCVGPILGGYVWSISIEGNPEGYPLGFLVCGCVCAVALLSSYMIR